MGQHLRGTFLGSQNPPSLFIKAFWVFTGVSTPHRPHEACAAHREVLSRLSGDQAELLEARALGCKASLVGGRSDELVEADGKCKEIPGPKEKT